MPPVPPACARSLVAPVARLIALASIALAAPSHAARDKAPAPPEDGARAFYAKVLAVRARGIPDAAQRRALAPAISRALASDLREAAEAERRHRKAARNDAPPLVQGDVFSSLVDGAREANVERCMAEGDHAQCVASLGFRDAFGGALRWQDRALLVRERGRWVVDDVAYEARWPFANKGTLRAALHDVVAQAPPPEQRGKGARPPPRAVSEPAAASRARGR